MVAFDSLRQWLRDATPARIFTFHHENVLGTSLELRVRATSPSAAEQAEEWALAEIDRLEPIFSSYNPNSEFRRWQSERGVPVRLSSELREVLTASELWRRRSGGAFNPASESLLQLWREAARGDRMPAPAEIAACRDKVAERAWLLDPETSVGTCLSRCPLTLNAIAKGYIVDRACEAAFQSHESVRGVILNIGGDLRIRSDREELAVITDPDQDAENAVPLTGVRIREGALATSGDWRRGFRIGERLYSHLIDPRTGEPAPQIRSASVLAPKAADADVLATIFSVLSPSESLVLADSLPEVGCLLITQEGKTYRSAHWRAQEVSFRSIRTN